MKLLPITVALTACVGWSKRDTALELGFAAATAADWHQTETIARYCEENNPAIGSCGQRIPVDIFMPTAIALHAVVATMLPPKWRTLWQAVGIGAEFNQVWSNHANEYWKPPIVIVGGMQVPYVRK